MAGGCRQVPFQHNGKINTINLFFRQPRTREGGKGGQHVNGRSQLIGHNTGGYGSHPAHDARNALTSFKRSAFSFPESTGISCMVAKIQPRAIVAGKNNQGVFIEPFFFQCLHDPSYVVVHFLYHIPVDSLFALAPEFRRSVDGNMGH